MTALHFAAALESGHIHCTLQLLCFGAEIDEEAIEGDKTELLRPIESRLKLLRNGNRMGTSLMSDEERHFMWNLAFVLAVKHPAIAFGTYQSIRSFVTFHGTIHGDMTLARKYLEEEERIAALLLLLLFVVVYFLVLMWWYLYILSK